MNKLEKRLEKELPASFNKILKMEKLSSAIIGKAFHLKRHFVGLPTEGDFYIEERKLPPLTDGEILVECLYLSVDSFMRPYSRYLKEGSVMSGNGIGRVIESKRTDYLVGCLIVGPFGWRTHHIPDRYKLDNSRLFQKIVDIEPITHALSVLGVPGLTAYFGFLDFCKPKAGESVFVNTAAGTVGSIVGQIAKIKGCYVVGCAGSDEKVTFLKEIGFDNGFNYKTANLDEVLTKYFPKGIDCFFDNVGGDMFDTTLSYMNRYGRVALCGCASQYNSNELPRGTYIHNHAIPKELSIGGFMATSFFEKAEEGIKPLKKWLDEGKLEVREHVVEGFENTPKAFISLFRGGNIGKLVVKVK